MLERFERPVKIICLAMALLLAWQLGSLILRGDPLAKLKIPPLPTLPGATNEPAKPSHKEKKGANADSGTNATSGTNAINGANVSHATNGMAKSTNSPAPSETARINASSGPKRAGLQSSGPPEGKPGLPPGMTPERMARMIGGEMPGGRMGGGQKKIELPPEVQARVDRIIDSEVFGPIIHPMPMALNGIGDQVACIRATNGQTDWVKVGGEIGGVKLLRIGVNRVLVEQNGEKIELTQFGGFGGESLMPNAANAPSTNMASTNAPSTNAPARRASNRNAAAKSASTTRTLSIKEKETP